MSNGMKITLTIVAIFIVIFAIIFVVYNQFKAQPMDANTIVEENILQDANTGLDNMLNEILNEQIEENVENVENIENNTEIDNTENTNTAKNESASNTSSKAEATDDDTSSTPREKKAIELVKEEWKSEWGNLSGVTFNNVGIQSDGQYRVSVNDSTTTEVLQFYIVDVDTGIVKEK